MKPHNKLIIVSNRLPITIEVSNENDIIYIQSSGGLISGITPFISPDTIWIGWPGISKDLLSKGQVESITSYLSSMGMIPVFLNGKQIEKYYNGFCNSVLWPQLHNRNIFCQKNKVNEYKKYYKRVNILFTKKILKTLSSNNATIWIHDYHLLLVPSLLQKFNVQSGFFLHTTFPHTKPNMTFFNLAKKLSSIRLVAFQTNRDAENFNFMINGKNRQNAKNILVDPIGINYEDFKKDIKSQKIFNACKMILTVDRLDPCKSITDRIQAFQLLIENNQSTIGNVKMHVLAVPSREDVDEYRKERCKVELLIKSINDKYGTKSWIPITYQYKCLDKTSLLKLYSLADIALICPPFDGMNLVAKEFVAVNNQKPKALILSSGVGASKQLKDAYIVEEYSINNIYLSLLTAINASPVELLSRMNKMNSNVKKFTSQWWGKKFLHAYDDRKTPR